LISHGELPESKHVRSDGDSMLCLCPMATWTYISTASTDGSHYLFNQLDLVGLRFKRVPFYGSVHGNGDRDISDLHAPTSSTLEFSGG
jgi:hypothetical protein